MGERADYFDYDAADLVPADWGTPLLYGALVLSLAALAALLWFVGRAVLAFTSGPHN
jgi:hypothetical protein